MFHSRLHQSVGWDFKAWPSLYMTLVVVGTLLNTNTTMSICSDFIWDFRKLPFPSPLGKHFIKIGKISAKIHEIGK